MRFAICISGHLNNWEKKYQTWINLFYKLNALSQFNSRYYPIDIFIHTWDFNIKDNQIENINNSSLLDFKNFIKPKSIIIDNFEKYNSRESHLNELRKQFINDETQNCLISKQGPNLYSLMMSSNLKREYELSNYFEYDVCIKMNCDAEFDVIANNSISDQFCIPENKVIYPASAIKTFNFPYDKIDYNFFFANSQTFDIISSMYNMLPMLNETHFDKKITDDLVFGFFLRMFDIKIKRLNISMNKIQILDNETI
jgi:hypothetical protein